MTARLTPNDEAWRRTPDAVKSAQQREGILRGPYPEAEPCCCSTSFRALAESYGAPGAHELGCPLMVSPPATVSRGVMTVDMGASGTDGRIAKIEAPPGCIFARADGTPYKVGDAIKAGDPVSYLEPCGNTWPAGGTVVMTGVRP